MIDSITLTNFRGFEDISILISRATMLTGSNGVGKTSVLEGLYCLFSETQLDVSPLARYSRTMGIHLNQASRMQSFASLIYYVAHKRPSISLISAESFLIISTVSRVFSFSYQHQTRHTVTVLQWV